MSATNLRARRAAYTILLASVVLWGGSPALSASYVVTDLGTLGGFTSDAFGVNNFGRVVGISSLSNANLHGYYRDGALTDIAPLTGDQSQAFGLNDSGQVVAMSYTLGDLVTHGERWQGGFTTNLGNIAPRGINAGGDVVGYYSTLDAAFGWVDHAAWWQNGSIFDLGTLGGHFSYALAISDDQRIVGYSLLADEVTRRATLWQNGVASDLGTLGGTISQAYAINSAGHVVGVADTAAGQAHAFLFTLNASGGVVSRTDLGALGGGYSYAYGINSLDVVVGTSNAAAFRWVGGVMTDLNTLLLPGQDWRLDAARAVSDQGQIVGTGLHHGQPRAFLLTPAPGLAIGDMNCDGTYGYTSFGDINPFVMYLSNIAAWQATYPGCPPENGDINGDGTFGQGSFGDINPFVTLLSQPPG
jgi:probable HAF family extracellular repeat protein